MHLTILRTLSSLAPGGLTTVARLPPRLPSSRPRIPLGTNTTLAQNAHRSELTRSLSSDKNSRQSVHDYKPRPAPHSLGSPVTVEAPAHWRSLARPPRPGRGSLGGGRGCSRSVWCWCGRSTHRRHTGQYCPAALSRTADGARYSAPREHTARHPASVRNVTSLKITFLCKYHITVVLV